MAGDRGFPARYPATCPRCHEPIDVGDRIVQTRNYTAIHVDCASGADE